MQELLIDGSEKDSKWTISLLKEKVRGDWHMSYLSEILHLYIFTTPITNYVAVTSHHTEACKGVATIYFLILKEKKLQINLNRM